MPGELPPVLARPPWTALPQRRKSEGEPAPLRLQPLPGEESVVWAEGERDLWLDAVLDHRLFSSAMDRFAFTLHLYGVHPRRWLAQQSTEWAIDSLVRAAAEQPEAGIEMCLPFRSPRLAPIVAREHLRRPRVRAAARRWLDRHAEHAPRWR